MKDAEVEKPRTTRRTAAATAPTAASRRKAKADNEEIEETVQRVTKGRARRAEVAEQQDDDDAEEKEIEAPKAKRGRPKKATTATCAPTAMQEEPAKKMTGRRKKDTTTAAEDDELATGGEQPIVTRQRGRAAAAEEKPAATRPTIKVKSAAASKKKVTFQEPTGQDKENRPMPTATSRKDGTAGLRANPVKKPAVPKSSLKGKKADVSKPAEESEPPKPLSPKKVKQLTKSDSNSSEDELTVAQKTPSKSLQRSPMKPPMSIHKAEVMEHVVPLKPDFSSTTPASPAKSSPTKALNLTAIMASPARRPPASPFKNAMKETPRRVHGNDIFTSKPSVAAPTPTTLKTSLLQTSPKRGHAFDNFPNLIPHSTVPLKASLLQTPARRPPSPIKMIAPGSPGKSSLVIPVTDPTTTTPSTFKLPTMDMEVSASCNFQAYSSPERSVKVHKMTPEEQPDFIRSPFDVASPMKAMQSIPTPSKPDNGLVQMQVHQEPHSPSHQAEMPSSPEVEMEDAELNELEDQENTKPIVQPAFHTSTTSTRSTTPPGPVPESITKAYHSRPSVFRDNNEIDVSDDELAYTPLNRQHVSTHDFAVPVVTPVAKTSRRVSRAKVGFTPLAAQLSGWLAASPSPEQAESDDGRVENYASPTGAKKRQSMNPHFFDDQMAVRDENGDISVISEDELVLSENMDHGLGKSQSLCADENMVPAESPARALGPREIVASEGITPAKLQVHANVASPDSLAPETPIQRQHHQRSRVIHTVSKVPLRPEHDDSPLLIPKKRSRSVSVGTDRRKSIFHPGIGRSNSVISLTPEKAAPAPPVTTTQESDLTLPSTPETSTQAATPAKTPRREPESTVLQGAVVFVDVHTSEGADASGIFVELLTQMGARCVKQWSWNPRSSVHGNSVDSNGEATGKVGITHVVFKDGGVRTLEKVRETRGVVMCVGVGWVLE